MRKNDEISLVRSEKSNYYARNKYGRPEAEKTKEPRRPKMEISDNLFEILYSKGISIDELGKRAGMSTVSISRYLRGMRSLHNARISTVIVICDVLKCSLCELLNYQEYPVYREHLDISSNAARLRSIRTTRGLTQRELSERINLGKNAIQKYESGEKNISNAKVSTVDRIARELGCNILDIVDEDEILRENKRKITID